MRCNACWQELEGQAVATACSHLFCTEDAKKILSNDAACPICDQALSKSLMKPVGINPSDHWINMANSGISPQILMKSAYRSLMFYIGQKELEMQYKVNRTVAQCAQKYEVMQQQFSEMLEQVQTAQQKMGKWLQMMEQEVENLCKDKKELQEKLAEKCRQKRKVYGMYDQLRTEYESVKRSAIRPAVPNMYLRTEPELFSNSAANMRNDWSVATPDTPGPREDIWPPPARQYSGNRMAGARPMFGLDP